jgi:uncharacterized membrane protein YkvI
VKYLGIVLVALALVAAIVPQFTDCSGLLQLANGKTTSMKCHWTAQAEIAVAIPLLAVGALMTFSKRKETFRALSISGIILGALIIALPTKLIGVCMTPTMVCRTAMQPALIGVGALAVGLSLVGTVFSFRIKE